MKIFNEKDIVKYRIIEHNDFEKIVDLCSQAFVKYEPMTRSLNITYEEFRRIAEPYCEKAIQEKLSTVATDSSGQIVGFVISENLMTQPPYFKGISEKFEPIQALSYQLRYNYYYRTQYYLQSFYVLHILMLGVKDEYKNYNIATNLISENLKLAKINSFSLAITEATGFVSQRIFRKLGFQEEVTLLYDTYTYNGQKVFASIKGSTGCTLMSYLIR